MRLHTLDLQAFGPFPDAEHVDFDALDQGILLVDGPTGSGKSSLLDAVTFALFGDVAGARRAQRQTLRSHHAPADREPSVELVFSAGDTRWKIRRVPQWEAPKRRGTGTTTRQASVLLSRWQDGDWHLTSSRIDEAGATMRETLGMDLDQFAQVVLLPQGEFAEFLRARPEDRRALLERLFDVARFDAVERWFAEERSRCVAARDAAGSTVEAHLGVIAETIERFGLDVAEEDGEQPSWADLPLAEVPTRLAGVLERLTDDNAARTHAAERAAASALAAERAADRSGELLRQQEAYAAALAEDEAWPATRVDELRERLDAAATAAQVLALIRRAATLADEARATAATRAERAARLEEFTGLAQVADADVEALLPAQELTQRGTRLHDLEAGLTRLERSITARARSTAALADAEVAVAAAQTARTDAAARETEADASLTAAQDALTARPNVASVLRDANAALTHGERGPALRERARAARTERDARAEEFAAAERAVLAARTARLGGLAAELAEGLTDSSPCPVCGSCTHPAPARHDDAVPTEEQIEAAEARATAARSAHLAAETAWAAAEQACTSHRDHLDELLADLADQQLLDVPRLRADDILDDDAALRDLRAMIADAAQRHDEASAAVLAAQTTLRDAQSVHATAATVHDLALVRREGAADQRAAADAEVRELTGHALRLAAELDLALGDLDPDDDTLDCCRAAQQIAAQAQEQHMRIVAAVRELAQAQHDAEAAQTRWATAESEAADAVRRHGFADAHEVSAVALTNTEIADLREQHRRGLEARARATAVLDDMAAGVDAFTPTPHLPDLQERATRLREAAEIAQQDAAHWQTGHTTLTGHRERLTQAMDDFGPLAQAAQEMQELAGSFTGTGENTHRMRLTSYVLAAHLETVTTMANERLRRMTDGRYELAHTDERAKGNQRSGLGLLVVDSWTGRSRDTATLSGGEAFMASLALALGLGDAVRADTGGMELHTLFVDEGFGSLDQDTLDHVMGVLDDLREGGRLVGVVSHVTELRARIPTRIEIRKTADGSSIHVPGPDLPGSGRHGAS